MVASEAARTTDRDRAKAAIGVIALHAVLGYALITALGVKMPARVREDLKLFQILAEPPPPAADPQPRPRAKRERRKEAAAPPNLKATPTEIVAPPAEIPLVLPPPVIAAPVAGPGSAASAGAAAVPGPGTGSGGAGTGTGGGGDGEGDGDEAFTPPRHIRGRIRDSDYPDWAGEAGIGGTITLQFTVETDGRVTACTILRSSGNATLDDATCRLIERRYRYAPSRDGEGRPVPSMVVEDHTWVIAEP